VSLFNADVIRCIGVGLCRYDTHDLMLFITILLYITYYLILVLGVGTPLHIKSYCPLFITCESALYHKILATPIAHNTNSNFPPNIFTHFDLSLPVYDFLKITSWSHYKSVIVVAIFVPNIFSSHTDSVESPVRSARRSSLKVDR
jgi:hypothetical protein